jgi:hypothetical protein
MTADEIRAIQIKICVAKHFQARHDTPKDTQVQYYRGLLDAYTKILEKLGGVQNG